MIPDKETRDIQAYLRGTLPKIRRENFEQKLLNDAEFKARFDEMKPVITALADIQIEQKVKEFIEQKKQAGSEITPIRKLQSLYIRTFQYAAAACVLLFLGIIWYDSTVNNRLYDEYYTPENAFRSNTIEGCPNENTLTLYYQKDYKSFLEVIQKRSPTVCSDYYQGLCFLALKDLKKAESLLSKTINADDNYIKQSSEWYLALTFLKMNEEQKATIILEKMVNSKGHQYEVMAKKLLAELKKKSILFKVKL